MLMSGYRKELTLANQLLPSCRSYRCLASKEISGRSVIHAFASYLGLRVCI